LIISARNNNNKKKRVALDIRQEEEHIYSRLRLLFCFVAFPVGMETIIPCSSSFSLRYSVHFCFLFLDVLFSTVLEFPFFFPPVSWNKPRRKKKEKKGDAVQQQHRKKVPNRALFSFLFLLFYFSETIHNNPLWCLIDTHQKMAGGEGLGGLTG
jgi:hypothetical protein